MKGVKGLGHDPSKGLGLNHRNTRESVASDRAVAAITVICALVVLFFA